MAKRAPRLQFSEEELANSAIRKAAAKADKAVDRLEKAESRIPKKKVKERVVSPDGKVTTRLSFEEKKPPSKLSHSLKDMPVDVLRAETHRKLREDGDDNSGTDALNTITETAEDTSRMIETAHRSHREKLYRKADSSGAAADRANIRALGKEYEHQNVSNVNPVSKRYQKKAIKKEYAAAKSGKSAGKTVKASEVTAKAAKNVAEKTKKAGEFVARHSKAFLIAGGIAALILVLITGISSCSVMFQGLSSSISATTYPSEDDDITAAEAAYCALEDELRLKLDNYETEHSYSEYRYELDDIGHDPYVLISAVTALMEGEWTIDEAGDILTMLFEKQYILTERVITETRTRTEIRQGMRIAIDPVTGAYMRDAGGRYIWEYYTYEVQVPYTWYICEVKLENFDLVNIPASVMTEEQLAMYSLYMRTLGNRPDLFPSSPYVELYYENEYEG